MKVPLFDISRQTAALWEELGPTVERVLRSGGYILGPEVNGFEEELASYIGAAHAIGVSNGTDALWLALRALDVGPGDMVLTTPFTFFATASSILACGAQPVFADIEPDGYNLDPTAVARVLAGECPVTHRLGLDPQRIKAIVPVHLYGRPAPMGQLQEIATRHSLPLVEDAAQALGARYGDRSAGVLGTLGCFSFFPTKNLGACGDAGAVTTDDAELARRVRELRTHGSQQKYRHDHAGSNCRLDALQAAILRVKLPHLNRFLAQRREHAAAYRAALRGLSWLQLPNEQPGEQHCYHQFTVAVRNGQRDALRAFLTERGVGCTVYYPSPAHQQQAVASLGYRAGDFPRTEQACAEVLSLPIFPELTGEERQHVIESVQAFVAA